MTLNAFKTGETINQDRMNSILCSQDFSFIFEGTQRDVKTGSGVTENSIADYWYFATFCTNAATTIGRIELELDKDGDGADLTIQIRYLISNILKEVVVPKEFIPSTAGWVSIPINLTGLSQYEYYLIVVKKAGDATNKIEWISESTTDVFYPCKRSTDNATWVDNNALHFKVYDNTVGTTIKHSIYGTNQVSNYTYDENGLITQATRYLPPSDTSDGGIRETLIINTSGGIITGGEIS